MSKWTVLSNAIREVIYSNGNRKITGQVLQNALLNIISNLGNFASFAGVATPSTNPGTPDGPVYYFATQAGTYTNFGALALDGSCYVLYWNGTAWSSAKLDLPTAAEITSAMNALIATESAARQQADTSLQSAIAAETTRATGKEQELESDVEDLQNEVFQYTEIELNSLLSPGTRYKTVIGETPTITPLDNYIGCKIDNLHIGDIYTIYGGAGNSGRLWAKIKNNVVISVGPGWLTEPTAEIITVDGTFDSIVFNVYDQYEYSLRKGTNSGNISYLRDEVDSLKDTTEEIADSCKITLSSREEIETSFISGYLNKNGTIGSSTTRTHSDYINIEGKSRLYLYQVGGVANGDWTVACFYDASKNFLYRIKNQNGNDTPVDLEVQIQYDAKYIVVGCNSSTGEPTKVFNIIDEVETLKSYVLRGGEKSFFWSPNFGKSMAIFGGSFSVIDASNIAKDYWKDKLNLTITNYGVGGAGFRKTTGGGTNNIMRQVDRAIASRNTYDIWLLWASTNDFWGGANYIGNENYYIDSSFSAPTYQEGDTDENGVDILDTQCGGMNYCIYRILNYQPTAKIMLFTSIRAMSTGERGYNPKSEHPGALVKYVAMQIAVAEKWGIPYLNQFLEFDINPITKATYITSDDLHPNAVGYNYFKERQVSFLATR